MDKPDQTPEYVEKKRKIKGISNSTVLFIHVSLYFGSAI